LGKELKATVQCGQKSYWIPCENQKEAEPSLFSIYLYNRES
jgi:hypothetical protein